MTLIDRVRKALEFDESRSWLDWQENYIAEDCEHDSAIKHAKRESARTAKLVEALVECADVIVCTTSNEYGFSVSDYSNDAIAQLELVLKEMEKS